MTETELEKLNKQIEKVIHEIAPLRRMSKTGDTLSPDDADRLEELMMRLDDLKEQRKQDKELIALQSKNQLVFNIVSITN
jgi:hypothetical protein